MGGKRISGKFNRIKYKIVLWLLKGIAIFMLKCEKVPNYGLVTHTKINGISYVIEFECKQFINKIIR